MAAILMITQPDKVVATPTVKPIDYTEVLNEISEKLNWTQGTNILVERKESDEDFVIPAGARAIIIQNVGFVGGGEQKTAKVNGQPISVGEADEYKQYHDHVTRTLHKCPEVSIETNGAMVWAVILK